MTQVSGYYTKWYDTRRTQKVTRKYYVNGVYVSTYMEDQGGIIGVYGWVTSWRGKKPRDLNSEPHTFESHKLIDKGSYGSYSYGPPNKAWELIYNGQLAGMTWFRGAMTTNKITLVDDTDMVSEVASELYQKATEPYVPSLLWMGEMLETLQAFKQPLASMRKLGNNLRVKHNGARKKYKNGQISSKQLMKEIAAAHLEFQFGIKPLFGMADAAVHKLADLSEYQNRTRVIYKVKRKEVVRTESGTYNGFVHWEDIQTLSVRGSMCVQHVETASRSVFENFKPFVLLSKFAVEGYQLIPLSFLLDWFVPLSKLLAECRPIEGRVISSTITVKQTRRKRYWIHDDIPNSYYRVITSDLQHEQIATHTKRFINVERPGKLFFGSGTNSLGKYMSSFSLRVGRMK